VKLNVIALKVTVIRVERLAGVVKRRSDELAVHIAVVVYGNVLVDESLILNGYQSFLLFGFGLNSNLAVRL
jgi:hypothetical protein